MNKRYEPRTPDPHFMTQHATESFVSDMDDIIAAGWVHVAQNLRRDWQKLTDITISNINGRANLLASALSTAYGISTDKAERITIALARDFDHFEETSDVFHQMKVYWPGFTREDFLIIKGRRSVLASILQQNFSLSRSHAWLQVDRFFTQIKP